MESFLFRSGARFRQLELRRWTRHCSLFCRYNIKKLKGQCDKFVLSHELVSPSPLISGSRYRIACSSFSYWIFGSFNRVTKKLPPTSLIVITNKSPLLQTLVADFLRFLLTWFGSFSLSLILQCEEYCTLKTGTCNCLPYGDPKLWISLQIFEQSTILSVFFSL